jgi:hypothetical protein
MKTDREFNTSATFEPQTTVDSMPCVTIAGINVYVYVYTGENGGSTLCVSVQGGEEAEIPTHDHAVPRVEFVLNEATVYETRTDPSVTG